MSLKDKLARMKGQTQDMVQGQGQGQGQNSAPCSRTQAPTAPPYLAQWTDLKATPVFHEDEMVMVREISYPLTHKHGRYAFAELPAILERWEEAGYAHPLSTGKQSTDLLFFDTETTGLGGGTGNTIFLLGYSRFTQDAVTMRQYFLPSPDAETALYHCFLTDVSSASHLVTYNGKSFDWPQVKTRHTLLRHYLPTLPTHDHVDLLHAARRLWKSELASCRLSLIEDKKLGVHRHDDIPGYMAPVLYFEYLRTRNPAILQGVLHHNQIDVLSLITLYTHISKLVLSTCSTCESTEESFAVAHWFGQLGELQEAKKRYEDIAIRSHPLRYQAKIALGHLYKSQKSWQQAIAIWEECIEEKSDLQPTLYIELSKLYEHQVKDYELALHYSRKALDILRVQNSVLRRHATKDLQAYLKRVRRLELKWDSTHRPPENHTHVSAGS